ncbi:hypothetical protein O3G_MSEX002241 [Manduca sexta]|uniref:Uncharacterized protein n=1 Tax=Manduca sexta TaxID=7130 RepID=A0A921YN71_MANSE|nr:hypothetical protein O3G_MSEX002241 [Manduca sexta]
MYIEKYGTVTVSLFHLKPILTALNQLTHKNLHFHTIQQISMMTLATTLMKHLGHNNCAGEMRMHSIKTIAPLRYHVLDAIRIISTMMMYESGRIHYELRSNQ